MKHHLIPVTNNRMYVDPLMYVYRAVGVAFVFGCLVMILAAFGFFFGSNAQKVCQALEGPHYEGFENVSYIPYSGYFSGGNIFVVFVVERRTTKYLPAKNTACARPKYEGNRATTKFFPRNSQNYDFHENITPRKIPTIRYIHV